LQQNSKNDADPFWLTIVSILLYERTIPSLIPAYAYHTDIASGTERKRDTLASELA
jgi:hypothetical protein